MEDSLGTSGVELDAMRRRTFSLLGLYLLGCSASGEPERASGAAAGTMQPPASGSTGPTSPTTSSGPPGTSTTANSSTAGDPGVTGDGPLFDIGPDETTGAPCDPVADDEQACDGIDDDCNGFIDDIDEGGDGICDCLAIALIGTPGGLASSQLQQWLIDRGTSADRIDPAVIDAAVLGGYDVLILDQLTREYTAAEAMAFDTWVSGGGGLMSMTGHTGNVVSAQQWPNSILSPMGLTYQGALLDGPVTNFELHPISAGLTSVTFLGGFEVVAANPAANSVVGTLPGGQIAGMAQERGAGKLFVWGDEWIEYDSEWESLPEINQLWVNIFAWISPISLCTPPPG